MHLSATTDCVWKIEQGNFWSEWTNLEANADVHASDRIKPIVCFVPWPQQQTGYYLSLPESKP